MNYLDDLVHDWGWWNRAYTRFLIRTRGHRLVSMAKTLPAVKAFSELTQHPNGAIFWLEGRESFQQLRAPQVALGEHAAYVVNYFRNEFPPREDRPFLAYFKNPVLYGRHFSILDSQKRAFQECFTRDRRWRDAVPKQAPQPRRVSGAYLLAGAEFHNHYAHLFCDILPRLKLFDEAGLLDHLPALLPPPSHTFAEEAWQAMGFTGTNSIRWDDTCWQLDGLYFASTYKQFCAWTPESAEWLRAKMAPGIEQQSAGPKIFYISRKGSRPILNEDEILRTLASYDLTVIQPETLPLSRQIELFAQAGMIIGPQGAGIQNCLWAPRGCRVLELVNARFFSGVYWTLAEALGQPYGLVTGVSPNSGDPRTEGYTCDPELVRQAIDRLTRAS